MPSSKINSAAKIDSIKPLKRVSTSFDKSEMTMLESGGVTSAQGFKATGIHAGFRKEVGRLDLALVVADEPCACAGVFTKNIFCSAPIVVSKENLDGVGYGSARAVVVNSGNANAATGEKGLAASRKTSTIVGDAVGCPSSEVMVASTGVIGVHLPLEPFEQGIRQAVDSLSKSNGALAAQAIMTTDTHSKEAAVVFSGDGIGYDGCTFTVGGMAKGSGMIMPNMATMIAIITTDAPLSGYDLHQSLARVSDESFNKVTVDSDTSTNDCCYLFASGAAAPVEAAPFVRGSAAFGRFEQALEAVCQNLARQLAADGEGATRLVTVNVSGAANDLDADLAARSVANSPLFKSAIYGHDANWGRIAMALGKSGAVFAQEKVSIDLMGIPVCRDGLTVLFDEEEALARFEQPEIIVDVDLGAGEAWTTVWTCDLTHDYVTINGDYRS